VRRFYGVGTEDIPAGMDLRAQGWRMLGALPERMEDWADLRQDSPIVVRHGAMEAGPWRQLTGPRGLRLRRWVLVLDVEDGEERARLLRKGFGDALPPETPLVELAERAGRVAENAAALRRFRRHGALRLDLLDRDGYIRGQALGLHPREFAVLWRLMETPGVAVEKLELLRDVWRVSHVPETNSVAVHASRLRSKLAAVGLAGLIQSTPGGGYQLVKAGAMAAGEE